MRRSTPVTALVLTALTALAFVGCDSKKKSAPAPTASEPSSKEAVIAEPKIDRSLLTIFTQLPEKMASPSAPMTDEQVALGKQLYFDTRLSKNHDLSCNSCHALDAYGVDNKAKSPGHKGQLGDRNSPTVYNAAVHTTQFWDGRAKDVEEQALGPILNPVEMAMPDEAAVLAVVRSIPEYVESFKKAFPSDKGDPVNFINVGKAIGAFERTLVTPSRWDKYLAGDDDALTKEERAGLAKFMEVGCNSCHMGAAVGGTDLKKLGLVKPWPELADNGRFEVTKDEADRHVFKVQSLRNIDKTGPYFHDGSVESLDEAVKLMARHQLGKELSAAEVTSIVTFLKSLTGELPKIDPPELPKSTAKTPKPDPT